MKELGLEIEEFLRENDIQFHRDADSISLGSSSLRIVPISIVQAGNLEYIEKIVQRSDFNANTIYLYEDRWRFQKEQVQQRILLRAGKFKSIFARNCQVFSNMERIKRFMEKYHSLGYIKSKYMLALMHKENIVAAATFSKPIVTTRQENGREQKYLSFEWTRYASLPDVSVIGGMGKLLNAFIEEIEAKPIEIMSYSDNEWSQGEAYKKLGFRQIEGLSPIPHYVNISTWERVRERNAKPHYMKIYNLGSRKWLLHTQAAPTAEE